ncbi:hypothetical protein GIB67_007190 [Kingdonia uniflora]|uniref:Pentatricopeptide repeat-containing protein n=1 Tax=Kingdonia uniflora TaxID=39325 RepID=A0A7J7NDG2_9MAGN|nr:hypothetical protein GIB67_007190 [Kingdonia uniflora]
MKKKKISMLHKVSTFASSFQFNPQSTLVHFEQFVRDRCKSGSLGIEEAMGLFNNAIQMRPLPSIYPFSQLLAVISKLKQYSTIITLFKSMGSAGIKATNVTLSTLSNCFCQIGKVDFGFSVVGYIFKSGYEPHIVIFTTFLKGFFKENRVKDAIQLFNKIARKRSWMKLCKFLKICVARGLTPNVITYNSLIDGLCKVGRVAVAQELFMEMQVRGPSPNIYTYSTLVNGLFTNGSYEEAMRLFEKMQIKLLG